MFDRFGLKIDTEYANIERYSNKPNDEKKICQFKDMINTMTWYEHDGEEDLQRETIHSSPEKCGGRISPWSLTLIMTNPPLRRAEHCMGNVAEAPASALEKSYWSSAISDQTFFDLKVYYMRFVWRVSYLTCKGRDKNIRHTTNLLLASCDSFS